MEGIFARSAMAHSFESQTKRFKRSLQAHDRYARSSGA